MAPANTSGLEDVLGRGGDVPSDGACSFLITAQFSGAGEPAAPAAKESVDRFRLRRAPHMKYTYLLPNGAHPMSRALEYLRLVARQTDSASARAVAAERECICESIRVSYTPYAASGKGVAPPGICP